jgi:hypothetical protein
MDSFAAALAAIKAAKLPAPTYRTARELLDLAGDNGQLKISKTAFCELCGTASIDTARGHLWQLQRAGLIHFSTNEAVHVAFAAFPTADRMLVESTQTRAQPTPTRATPTRAGSPEPNNNGCMLVESTQTRAQPTPTRATPTSPHTRDDRLIDRSSDPSQNAINQSISPAPSGPHRVPRQPWEAPLSFRLLTDKRIAMRRADAERLAEAHPFRDVRDAVAHWWQNRKAAGGRFEDYPGIVVYWLDNLADTVLPLASDEFLRTDLARAYLPPDEAEADEAEAEEAAAAAATDLPDHRPAPPPAPAPDPGTPAAYWSQLVSELAIEQGGSFDRWVHDTWVLDHDAATNTYVIALPDAYRYDWIVNRLSKQIHRKMRVITGGDVVVTFTVAARPAAEGGE